MTGLTPMERELLKTVGRIQTEAQEREQRLNERIDGLTTQLGELTKHLDVLVAALDPA